ncbi:hypothetical protein SBOR_4707 [Sclerotinia borealis F-4128]|uniref:Uncharacterized protein n=1 Tax=Sclerotinia borealis (strain F-4128) TaxID=1432307 RepID=W9CK74_SCLBF|nr:hypothetical protein SBOR_4707 [Sclerotinia borealis F-4128]
MLPRLSPTFIPLDHGFKSIERSWDFFCPYKRWVDDRVVAGDMLRSTLEHHREQCIEWAKEYHGDLNTYSKYAAQVLYAEYQYPGENFDGVVPDPDPVYSDVFAGYFQDQKYLREVVNDREGLCKLLDKFFHCDLRSSNSNNMASLVGIIRNVTRSLIESANSQYETLKQNDTVVNKDLMHKNEKDQLGNDSKKVWKDEQCLPISTDEGKFQEAAEKLTEGYFVTKEGAEEVNFIRAATVDSDDDFENLECSEGSMESNRAASEEAASNSIENDDDSWVLA